MMNVVILGAGFTGLSAAITLSKSPPARCETTITLVEPKPFFEIRWASIRSMFEQSIASGSTIPLSDILSTHPTITHVRARATRVLIDCVHLDNGQVLPFHALFIATGSITSFPTLTPHAAPSFATSEREAVEERRALLRDTGEAILSASSVCIIGGGPVGVELAADIKAYANRRRKRVRVMLIDAKDRLVSKYSKMGSQRVEEKLSSMSIDVLLKHRALQLTEDVWVVKETGMPLNADLVIRCTGVRPSAADLLSGVSDSATRQGWVRTDAFGRVLGMRGNVFGAGDCCDWPSKSAENTLSNRFAYAHNLRVTIEALARSRGLASVDGKLRRVSTERNVVVLTSGPKDGVAVSAVGAHSLVLPWLKNRGMYLSKAKRGIGW